MTKVCHIITKLELGGAQQNTLYTAGHLDKQKFDVILISGKGGILDADASKLPGVRVYFLPGLIRRTYPWSDLTAFVSLYLILRKEKPAIVHTHSSKAGILGRWAAKLAGVPVIIHTFHGFGFHDFQPLPVKKLFVFIEKITARISTKLIAVSNDNIHKGIENGIGHAGQYTVIRSGIDIEKYKNTRIDYAAKRKELSLPEKQPVVLTIGPFKPQKNLRDFIKVANLIALREPGLKCVFAVVGDGAQRPLLESLVKRYGLEERVKLLGWRRDTNELMALCDVFVMTSLWEGLPRAVLEAMSAGKAVVANAVDGVREAVKDSETGYLVQPHDCKAMAGLIINLLKNPGLAAAMGLKGQSLMGKEYDINYMVRRQEELYESVLKIK